MPKKSKSKGWTNSKHVKAKKNREQAKIQDTDLEDFSTQSGISDSPELCINQNKKKGPKLEIKKGKKHSINETTQDSIELHKNKDKQTGPKLAVKKGKQHSKKETQEPSQPKKRKIQNTGVLKANERTGGKSNQEMTISNAKNPVTNISELAQRFYTESVHILRGTICQADLRYSEISRNKQCTPIAVTALAYNRILPFSAWNAQTIQDILDYGDSLYRKSIRERSFQNLANVSSHPYLMLQEVHSKFIINNYGFNLIIHETNNVDGRIGLENEEPFFKLADGLPQIFQNYESAVLTCNSLSTCIFRDSDTAYYLFDSHARGADGKACEYGGKACLIKFRSVDHLLSFLLQNYPANEVYCLSPIEFRLESAATLRNRSSYAVLSVLDTCSPPVTLDCIQNSLDSLNMFTEQDNSVTPKPPNSTTVVRDAASKHTDVPLLYLGKMDVVCSYCGALFFRNENLFCCNNGAVQVANSPEYPDLLKSLITDMHPQSRGFLRNIRRYNTLLALGSTSADLRKDLGHGAPVVVVAGQIHHRLRNVGTFNPRFGSLYFIDSGEAKRARANAAVGKDCEAGLLAQIDALLRTTHPFAQMYRSLGQKVEDERRTHGSDRIPEIGLYFHTMPGTNRSVYAAPSNTDEIGAVFTSVDGNMPPPRNCVRVFYREGSAECTDIPKMSPIVDALCYPLLFPHGELGWAMNMQRFGNNDKKRKRISKREFDLYRLMSRSGRFNPILLCGKLSQQYIVDKYAELEGDRLNYLRIHQKDVRADTYVGLLDYIARKNEREPVESERIGKVVILPSSFSGGPRNMQQRYQDAMSIVAKFGRPSLFVTFTCNPNWREIRENLGTKLLNPQDRPELIARIFDLKRKALFEDILKNKIFGNVIAYVYVVEFQKRGLPHLHWLLFLADGDKLREPDDVDRLICAELPAANTRLFDIIVATMIHGPCGDLFPNSPCMEEGVCTKRYPKEYSENTVIDRRRPIYRRRNDGRSVALMKNGISYTVDNRDVIPYNPYLSMKYDSHINVEVVTSVGAVKYVFKYINKGPDAAVIQAKNEQVFDEIRAYIDSRYLSAGEAAFKLLPLKTHGNTPNVYQLPVHLPGERPVQFVEGEEEAAVRRQEGKLSRLEAYFELNGSDPRATQYAYCEIPLHYSWANGRWRRRSRVKSVVTRMFTISPKYVEKFHLRILLQYVRGAKSFEDLRTYNGIVYPTFQEAARIRLLVASDDEWKKTLEQAALVDMPKCMRKMFAYMLCYCEIGNPLALWVAFKHHMCEDFLRKNLSGEDAENCALRGIENILGYLGKSLKDFGLPEYRPVSVGIDDDEDVDIDASVNAEIAAKFDPAKLNPEQRDVFDRVVTAIENDAPDRYFYLGGSGGTGKTHLYNALLTFCRTRGVSTIAVAFTGIAALLLQDGCTAHSKFKLPLNVDAETRSCMTAQSEEAATLRRLRVMIWDEVSMASYHVLNAVDRLLQDLRNDCRPFGGLCVLLRGDVKQLPPVATGRVEQVELFFTNCNAWAHFKALELKVNMRVDTGEREFAGWLEQLGQGLLNESVTDDSNNDVCLPEHCLTDNLIGEIFGRFDTLTPEQLSTRAILCPRNEHCNRLNDIMLESFPGNIITIRSNDSVASGDADEIANYQLEYLNSITPSGMPLHELKLKVGVPIILLRNISLKDGLINGTRLLVLSATDSLLIAKSVTGRFSGREHFISRMDLTSSDKTLPITLKRRQFPVKVCFALTINKAQGQTFDKVGIYLGSPVFSHGQLYVAFSRARNWNAVKVKVDESKKQGKLLKFSKNIYTKNIIYDSILNSIK